MLSPEKLSVSLLFPCYSVSQLSQVREYEAQWVLCTLTVLHTLEKGYKKTARFLKGLVCI
jgi:hypothetical protein